MKKFIGMLLLSLLFGCTSKMETATISPTLPIPTLTNQPPTTIPTNTLPPEIMGEKPEPRSGGLMVYDSARGVSILLGGEAEPDIYLDDMWEYDGFEWKKLNVKSPVGGWFLSNLAYDVNRKKTVLFNWAKSEFWEFDGTSWEKVEILTDISIRWSVMTYNPIVKRIIIFGEQNESGIYETWSYDGKNLYRIDRSSPWEDWGWKYGDNDIHRIIFPSMVYYITNQELILQPGLSWTFAMREYDWYIKVHESESILPKQNISGFPRMVYDQRRDVIVLVEGVYAGRATSDGGEWFLSDFVVMEYSNSNWSQVSTEFVPTLRNLPALTYDEARGLVVLFGGINGDNKELNDVWEYDGVNWIER